MAAMRGVGTDHSVQAVIYPRENGQYDMVILIDHQKVCRILRGISQQATRTIWAAIEGANA